MIIGLKVLTFNEFCNKPINYLEIGVFYGWNLLTVCDTYARHPESKTVAIDLWGDYAWHHDIYKSFLENCENFGFKDKIEMIRGLSHIEVSKLQDGYFDMIYIDADHEPHAVLEDAVVAFRKLKVGGYMIFDDYGYGGPDLTQRGIDSFINGYYKKLEVILPKPDHQMIVKKIAPFGGYINGIFT